MKLLLFVLSISFIITACGNNNKGRVAPVNESELGIITNADKKNIEKAGFDYQVISDAPGLEFYEIMNASYSEVKAALPQALIAKNKIIRQESASFNQPSEEKLIKQFNTQSSEDFSLEGCFPDRGLLRPSIDLVDEQTVPRFLTEEDTITLTARNSKSANELPFEMAWSIVAPLGSNIKPDFISGTDLKVEFDMAGVYQVNLFLRQGFTCRAVSVPLPVTNNPMPLDLDLETTKQEVTRQLSDTSFKQIELMGVKEAQQASTQGKGVVVAVLDSGVNYNHPSLAGKIWKNPGESFNGEDSDDNKRVDDVVGYDFVNDDPYPMDDNGHGSHVAGLIAGTSIGVAPNATIMPVKVMHALGFSDTGTILSGLVYAVLNGADIVNMSLGGFGIEDDIIDMYLSIYQAAENRNVLIVAAAGNGHPQTGRSLNIDVFPTFPAALQFENILSVGASDSKGELTYYSNYGTDSVDLVAVGGVDFDIRARRPVDELLYSAYIPNPNNTQLHPAMGTSMAAPIAAGMTAILKGEKTELTPQENIELLTKSVTKIPSLEELVKSGGMANIDSALKLLNEGALAP